MAQTPITAYIATLEANLAHKHTEHTHRPALQVLLEAEGAACRHQPVRATNEPGRLAVGAPDFIVTQGLSTLGYVEAKKVGDVLDPNTEQLRRYREGLGNLLFTDYLTFQWFALGEARNEPLTLADWQPKTKKLVPRPGAERQLTELLTAFFHFAAPAPPTPRELAQRMAAAARLLREAVEKAFATEKAKGELHNQFEAFREVLIHDLTPAQFADMYAQTLAYGLFAARATDPANVAFSRATAAYRVPVTNPFLRRLFNSVAGPDLDDRIAWIVDDLVDLLARADMVAVLRDFGRRTRQEDAVVHFYETFLHAYDPTLRELRGVYYTPEPAVGYLVRAVDALLADPATFNLPEGLAHAGKVTLPGRTPAEPARTLHRVQVLDPATGTGTFLAAVIRAIHARFAGNAGMWDGYVAEHLLPRIHGFELLMAPYTVAHMKLSLLLAETDYSFSSGERLSVYLTSALDEAGYTGSLPFAQWLAEEANAAAYVKREVPVMVVLGNPPYSGESVNKGEWITKLMHGVDLHTGRPTENYFEVDGQPLGETQMKWLSNDYVKFIRMAQHRIQQNGQGVLAFISDNSFLDNPTFRGMRQSLLHSFDILYILDLHGNANKKERAPDGGPDQNVFDIRQGVSISVFVLTGQLRAAGALAAVRHHERYGTREAKYDWLDTHELVTTSWTSIQPVAPLYLFRPQEQVLASEFRTGFSIPEIFPEKGLGIVAGRQHLNYQFRAAEAWQTAERFVSLSVEDARQEFELGDDTDWRVADAQQDLRRNGLDENLIIPFVFNPFDIRYTYYTGNSNGFLARPAREVVRHLLVGGNLALISTRQMREPWDCLITEHAIGHKALSAYDINSLFPLWLHPDPADGSLFAPPEPRANLAPGLVAALAAATGLTYAETGPAAPAAFAPADVLHYCYGLLNAPVYRARYADFLRTEFARVPLPPDATTFRALAAVGARLAGLHLLRGLTGASVTYPVGGSNTVTDHRRFPQYDAAAQRVYLNADQYFGPIAPTTWAAQVGGYQVLHKWLKDRRGRTLTFDELTHYRRTAEALAATPALAAEADAIVTEAWAW